MDSLLGVIAKDGVPGQLLTGFFALAENGKIGADFGCSGDKTRGHKDSWGIAVLAEKEKINAKGSSVESESSVRVSTILP